MNYLIIGSLGFLFYTLGNNMELKKREGIINSTIYLLIVLGVLIFVGNKNYFYLEKLT